MPLHLGLVCLDRDHVLLGLDGVVHMVLMCWDGDEADDLSLDVTNLRAQWVYAGGYLSLPRRRPRC